MILLYFMLSTLLLHILMMYVTRYIIKNKSEKHILRRTCDESGLISELRIDGSAELGFYYENDNSFEYDYGKCIHVRFGGICYYYHWCKNNKVSRRVKYGFTLTDTCDTKCFPGELFLYYGDYEKNHKLIDLPWSYDSAYTEYLDAKTRQWKKHVINESLDDEILTQITRNYNLDWDGGVYDVNIKLSVYRRKWRMNIFKFLHIPLYTKFSYTLDWDSSRGIIKSKRGGVWSASIYLEGGHWMERSNAIRTELHKKVLSSKKFKLTSDKDWNEYVNILISEFDEYTKRECVTLCES